MAAVSLPDPHLAPERVEKPLPSAPKKEAEDLKVVLDVALWVIFYLGVQGTIPHELLPISVIAILLGRFVLDYVQHADKGPLLQCAEKVAKYSPYLEVAVGLALNFAMMAGAVNISWNIWGLFAAQLGLTLAAQISKRVSGPDQYESHSDNKKKYLEDVKCILENALLWLIFALGDFGVLNPIGMGIGGLVVLTFRSMSDYHIQKIDGPTKNSSEKVMKVAAILEFVAGAVLMSLMISHHMSSDQALWLFFAMQLFTMTMMQIGKRVAGKDEERYKCFDVAPVPPKEAPPPLSVGSESNRGVVATEPKRV
jgi:hypothetical protein